MAINNINPWGGGLWMPTSAPACLAGPLSFGGVSPCGGGGGENDLRFAMMRQLHWMESMLERLASMLGGGGAMPCAQTGVGLPAMRGGWDAPCGAAAPAFAPVAPARAASSPARPASNPAPAPASAAPAGGSGQKAGAPPGYKTIKGTVPAGVTAKAKSLLNQPMGSEHCFESEGKSYLARLEHHYHPPGYQGGPNGWHKGVSVYEKV